MRHMEKIDRFMVATGRQLGKTQGVRRHMLYMRNKAVVLHLKSSTAIPEKVQKSCLDFLAQSPQEF